MSTRAIVVLSTAVALLIAGIVVGIAAALGAFNSTQGPKLAAVPPLTVLPSGPTSGVGTLAGIPRALFGGAPTAARYLGIPTAQLLVDVKNGKTLAQLAKERHKSVPGLVAALVAREKQLLRRAIATGSLTQEQARLLDSNLPQLVRSVVKNGVGPRLGFGQ